MQSSTKHNTAILVFANSSEEDAKSKSLINGHRLFDALTEATLKTVKKTKIPFFLVSEKQQYGNSFGERFAHAIQDVFNKGYENVITLGNDTPHLQTSHILDAYHQLNTDTFVLGPSTDGGFYLMGLHKSMFHKTAFVNLPWQTTKLAKALTTIIQPSQIEVIYLQRLRDLDSGFDLKIIAKSFTSLSSKLLQIILKLLNLLPRYFKKSMACKYFTLSDSYYNKGSPILLPISF